MAAVVGQGDTAGGAVVTGRYPSGGALAEQDVAALAALQAHVDDTTNVHGMTDTLEIESAVSEDLLDGPDFLLIWNNLMA